MLIVFLLDDTKGLPSRMGLMGLSVNNVPLPLSVSERVPSKGVDPPRKGVKQGCSLAPLLFVLAADALSKCTSKACDHGLLKEYQTASYLGGIPILQYADDTTFSIAGSMEEARNLSMLLDLFTDLSGLQINRAKLVFIGFGQPCEEETLCSVALGTPTGSLPIRYLGWP